MSGAQASLFDDDDAARPAEQLPVRAPVGRKKDRKTQAFDRLLARVESLRQRVDLRKRSLEQALVLHAAEVRPRLDRTIALRKDVVRALWPFTNDARIRKADRRVLIGIVSALIAAIISQDEAPEADIQEIFAQVNGQSWRDAVQENLDDARSAMAEMFGAMGLDVDIPELRPDMTDEEKAVVGAQMAERLQQLAGDADDAAGAPVRGSGKRAAQREAREQARRQRADEMRKVSIVASYRRLVKALHPDLEQDPGERARKGAAMQEVTTAYKRGDVLSLLRFEREWLGSAPIGADKHADAEARDAYTQALTEQAEALILEYEALHLEPRYHALIVDGPFGIPTVMDGASEVERLDVLIDSLRSSLADLTGGNALGMVRDLIRAEKASGRRRLRHENVFLDDPVPFDPFGFAPAGTPRTATRRRARRRTGGAR